MITSRTTATTTAGASCIDATAFSIPALGTYGTLKAEFHPRSRVQQCQLFSLQETSKSGENLKFQFRAEAGNLFNHPSAGNPNSEIEQGFDPANPVATSNFGTVTSTSTFYSPRSLQLAGKLVF